MPTHHTVEAQMDGSAELKTEGEVDHNHSKWQYRQTIRINQRLADIVKLSIEATQQEIKALRRKVDKLTYGS